MTCKHNWLPLGPGEEQYRYAKCSTCNDEMHWESILLEHTEATDKEKIIAIFDKRAIGYQINEFPGGGSSEIYFEDGDKGFKGRDGFSGNITFDKDGKLIGTGAWL